MSNFIPELLNRSAEIHSTCFSPSESFLRFVFATQLIWVKNRKASTPLLAIPNIKWICSSSWMKFNKTLGKKRFKVNHGSMVQQPAFIKCYKIEMTLSEAGIKLAKISFAGCQKWKCSWKSICFLHPFHLLLLTDRLVLQNPGSRNT